uniref:DNA/RNA-binding domain-containing protein n=1 Tax=Rhizophora mucronata TaxID=61149 RepID=A0A2P2K148_RHIMU
MILQNKSSHFPSLSCDAHFDFLKPSESSRQSQSQSTNDQVESENEGCRETNPWPLIVRVMGFFIIKSSLDDFPYTFASAMKELDVLMELDDTKLKAAVETYQLIGSARSRPFRTLQAVSVFIFVIDNLINNTEAKDSNNKKDPQQIALAQLALASTFIFMGRLVDRCLNAYLLDSCPLLPAILVFVEWLVDIIDEAEIYETDERCTSAISYFFGALLELLWQLDRNRVDVKALSSTALWEDYELRGFAPLAHSHLSREFSSNWGYSSSSESEFECRALRIINAAIKIADRPSSNCKWIFYNRSEKKFSTLEPKRPLDRNEIEKLESCCAVVEAKEAQQHCHYNPEEFEKLVDPPHLLGKPVALEEEEVILFKPLTRYNSAPPHGFFTGSDQMPPKEAGDPMVGADECLRRATSLLIAQVQGDPSTLHSDMTNFKRSKVLKWQEPLVTDMVSHAFLESPSSPGASSFGSSISAGPPSLNAWVPEQSSLSSERAMGKTYFTKHGLTPIEELASASLNDLSINGTEDSLKYSTTNSPAYSAPLPSAPFLPDGVGWFSGTQSTFSNHNRPSINRANHFYGVSQGSGNTNWAMSHQPVDHNPSNPGFVDGYTPFHCMTSSEWLHQYREHHNLQQPISNAWPAHSYAAGSTRNINGDDITRSHLLDQWASPMSPGPSIYEESQPFPPSFPPIYGTDQQRREKLILGYQRASPYLCGPGNESASLLQYLKEKEWLLRQDPTLRGPTYMGS